MKYNDFQTDELTNNPLYDIPRLCANTAILRQNGKWYKRQKIETSQQS
jgi:hypothetical protein